MSDRIYYQGADGHTKVLGDNELMHFKYIKKIGKRYFYTPEELKAYYEDQQASARREAAFGGNAEDFKRQEARKARDDYRNERRDAEKKVSDDTGIIYRDKNDRLRVRDKTKKEKTADRKKIDKKYKREARVDRLIDKLSDSKSSAERKTRALRKTVKMAAKGKEKPKTT